MTYKAKRLRCSYRPEEFYEKAVLKNFTKFIGKHLRIKAINFIKKKSPTQVSSCEFCDICKNTFFTEYLQATAGDSGQKLTSDEYLKKNWY